MQAKAEVIRAIYTEFSAMDRALTKFDEETDDNAEKFRAAKEAVLDFLAGKTEWGNTRIVGLSDDYITFIEDDELYLKTVPENVRKTMSALVQSLKDGSRVLP